MPRFSYGSTVKGRVKRLLEALLSLANWEFDEPIPNIMFNWRAEDSLRPKLIVKTRLIDLERLTEKDRYRSPEKLNKEQIREALTILKDFLKILEDNRTKTQGAEIWHFTLNLWSKYKEENLKRFDKAWENCRTEKSKELEETFQKSPVIVEAINHLEIPEGSVTLDSPYKSLVIAEAINYLEIPEGSVTLDSPFYIERPPIESDCYQTILQPGALIRIRAPRQLGKTSLLRRILHYASQRGHQTAYLSLQSADAELLTNLDQLLQWLCTSITYELNIEDRLEDYWNKGIGSKHKCSNYFQRYLLSTVHEPLTLGLDEVDRIFHDSEIAQDFFGLLRFWHERSKSDTTWRKLRLVIAHSQEIYLSQNIKQSPFHVGLAIGLPVLTQEQVYELVKRYGLDWSPYEIEALIEMVGGHPYLLRKALYEIARGYLNLEQFLQVAPTEEGLYSAHLGRHLLNLTDAKLEAAMKQVVATSDPVRLEADKAFKLRSMGLVQLRGNDVVPLCNLYRLYFRDRLGVDL